MNFPRPNNFPRQQQPSQRSPNTQHQQRSQFPPGQAPNRPVGGNGSGGIPGYPPSAHALNQNHNYNNQRPMGSSVGPGPMPSSGYGYYNQPQSRSASASQPSFNYSNSDLQSNRSLVSNKIKDDCYNKFIKDNGTSVRETTYITHIGIKEFSQFSAAPPPKDLSPEKLGSVKDRILVVCSKYSGRVLLQKGKFNNQKNQYQIGRTWDLDELKCITRVDDDGFILKLNKDYFWKSDEGFERIEKFSKNLTKTFGSFTGKYPELVGFSIMEFDLPITPIKKSFSATNNSHDVVNPQPDAQLLKSKSLKRKNLPQPVLPVQPQSRQASQSSFNQTPDNNSDYYKDLDFTANGKLPMKPMKVMDRSNTSQTTLEDLNMASTAHTCRDNLQDSDYNTTNNNVSSNHPYNSFNPSQSEAEVTNDSQSFIFGNDESHGSGTASGIGAGNVDGLGSSNHKENRKVSEPFETKAELSRQLELKLEDPNNTFGSNPKSDFSIEEVDDTDEENNQNMILDEFRNELQPVSKNGKSSGDKNNRSIEEIVDHESVNDTSNDVVEVTAPPKAADSKRLSTIDTSIQEIEEFMDSQLSFGGGQNAKSSRGHKEFTMPSFNEMGMADSLEADVLDDKSFSITENETVLTETENDQEFQLNIKKKDDLFQTEKDPEVEELLDELQWDMNDNGDNLISKLTSELNKIKYANVKELINLDFSGNSEREDLTNSLKEIENINHVFSKMEVNFKNLGPEINLIENNSQGLQVKSINKKLLYNDLKSILNKISMNEKDLTNVERFKEFDRLNKLSSLEEQVLNLYNALETIKQDNEDFDMNDNEDEASIDKYQNQLYSMSALKKYFSQYEYVSNKFIKHFVQFFKDAFKSRIEQLSNLDRIYPKSVFVELNSLVIYSPLTFFIKSLASNEFNDLKQFVISSLSEFLELFLKHRLKAIKYFSSSNKSEANTLSITKSKSNNDSNSNHSTPGLSGISKFENTEHMTLKKSRTLRLSTRKDKLIGRLGFQDDDKAEASSNSKLNENSDPLSPQTNSGVDNGDYFMLGPQAVGNNGIEDTKTIVDMVSETKDLSIIFSTLVGQLFHYSNDIYDLNDYLKFNSFETRLHALEATSIDPEIGSYSNELVSSLNSIFGNYTNLFIKKVLPVEYNVPIILVHLDTVSIESQKFNHDFFVFNFLKKLIDKYKSLWNKFIKLLVDGVNKSSISAKCGILPSIKNINQFFHLIESALDKPSRLQGELHDANVKILLNESYKQIADSLVHMFDKDDPLLKNNEFDEKERNYRNVSILQNIFSLLEQLILFNNDRTNKLKAQLETVFKKVQEVYFSRLLNQNVSKIIEFVNNYEALTDNNVKTKKYNKKAVKAILSNYSTKDLTSKVGEIRRKLEKHFLSGNDMFEKDLLDKLWNDMEKQFVNLFFRLDKILSRNYSEIDFHISKQEIHSIFRSFS